MSALSLNVRVSKATEVTEASNINLLSRPEALSKVIHKNYILDDIGALKKKIRHENQSEAFDMGTDAANGSNVVILLRTSFFEYVKNEYISELARMKGITGIQNAMGARAATEMSGEAFVEYLLEVSFVVQNTSYTVKISAYTTSCKVIFQPIGHPANAKVISSSKSISRFFVDSYFLPWCQSSSLKKEYDSAALIEAINDEIRGLDVLKLGNKRSKSRSRAGSLASSEAKKCVAKGCRYAGINTNNKTAVGVCRLCGSFEHFDCSKTSTEDREEILKCSQVYVCTLCFLKKPSKVTF